jgi:hypothetical protein
MTTKTIKDLIKAIVKKDAIESEKLYKKVLATNATKAVDQFSKLIAKKSLKEGASRHKWAKTLTDIYGKGDSDLASVPIKLVFQPDGKTGGMLVYMAPDISVVEKLWKDMGWPTQSLWIMYDVYTGNLPLGVETTKVTKMTVGRIEQSIPSDKLPDLKSEIRLRGKKIVEI